MWNLHTLATTYHTRPSAVLGIADDWAAYQFDMAVLSFAQHVEAQLNKKIPLKRILSETGTGPIVDASLIGPVRAVMIGEDGTW
jgi:hypothetical protein